MMNSDKAFEHRGTMEWQISSGEIVWSHGASQILGIAPDEVTSLDDFLTHIHDDDREITKRAIMLAIDHLISNIFNFRFIRPDTEAELFIHSIWCVESDGSGKAVKVEGTLLDVTKKGLAA